MYKVLVLGSSGILGNQIYKELLKINNINLYHTGLKKKKLDFTIINELEKYLLKINPDLIINCIAYTNIEKCEKFKFISKKINFGIVNNIFKIKAKKKLNFKLIHFSTDQFYNKKKQKFSKETSKLFILNNYSKHKRMAELKCIKNNCLIFRTNFFGKSIKNKTFSDWIFNSFKKNFFFYLINDVYFNPLRITTIAKIISFIIIKKKYSFNGLYNLGSRDGILKSEFALVFAKKIGIINNNYKYIKANKLLKVKRSNNMLMDVGKFEKKFKYILPTLKAEIKNEVFNYI